MRWTKCCVTFLICFSLIALESGARERVGPDPSASAGSEPQARSFQSDPRHDIADGAFDVLSDASQWTEVAVRGVPLRDGLMETLHVREFEVFAPDARVFVVDGDKEVVRAPAARRFFKGEVIGFPGSLVVLNANDESLGGFIRVDDEIFTIERNETRGGKRGFVTRRIDDDELPEGVRTWKCETAGHRPPDAFEEDSVRVLEEPVTPNAFASSFKRRLRISVDTDYELTVKLGSTALVETYVANVTAAVSALYEADLNTTLVIGDLFTYSTSSDPWSATSSLNQLFEIGDYWQANRSIASFPRSTVVFPSGKNTGGGVAWLGVLCRDANFISSGHYGGGYAVWGSLSGVVNSSDPSQPGYWDVLAYAHELGHNANSNHTHCIPSTGYGRTFVDYCYNGEAADGCYAAAESVPTEKGTIMSYCHLLAPGYSNVRMIFGKAGEASEAVLPPMTSHINSKTYTGTMNSSAETVNAGSTGNTATFTPSVGGLTFTWAITNGTITGGQGTATVTYTAGVSGQVTLKATAVDAKGCGVIGTGTVDIASGPPAPTNVVATATTGTSVTVTWTASLGATSYEVARSTNGSAYVALGNTSMLTYTDNTASAAVAYLYKVRAVAPGTGAYSAPDLATTVIFTDPVIAQFSTTLKAAHVSELRVAVNAVRTLAGEVAASFTDPVLVAGSAAKALHITELRAALDEARSTLALAAQTYADPTITGGSTLVKTSHMNELRNGVR